MVAPFLLIQSPTADRMRTDSSGIVPSGLGPMFNARSCDACHNNDGRGRPPVKDDEQPVSLVLQFATPAVLLQRVTAATRGEKWTDAM